MAGLANKLYQRVWGPDCMDAPTAVPTMTLADARREVAILLPGAGIRRHLLWRYVLSWQKPVTER